MTKGFSPSRITSSLPYCPQWETPLPLEANLESLNQPFYFLGTGAQCFAFLSQDGTTVIKFFKLKRSRPLDYLTQFPIATALSSSLRERKQNLMIRASRALQSYHTAFQVMPQESGVLMCHLNKTTSLNKTITLYDALGIEREVDLDRVEFLVQKRVSPAHSTITLHMSKGEVSEAKQCLTALVTLAVEMAAKGVHDVDRNFFTNDGLLDGMAIKLDVGNLVPGRKWANKGEFSEEVRTHLARLSGWIHKKHPELLAHLEGETFRLIEEKYHE